MQIAADGTDITPSTPCEILLEILRATETEHPFAFVLEEQCYVRHLDGGAGRCGSFPWNEQVVDRLAAFQRERANPEAAAWLAEELRLFLGKLGWNLDEEILQSALDAGRPVHLTLRLGAAELYALPWELVPLGATGRPLGSVPGVLLRYEWPDTRTARPEPDPPPEGGRVLFAWSAAGGVVPAEEHLAAIRRACLDGRHPDFDRTRDVVPHASLGRLREAMRAEPVAVLHLLCHGAQLDPRSGSYGLVLDADDRSGREIVDARSLQVALADHLGSLRLVVLCACHGGDPGALDSRLGSVAQALHRAGVPAVVASRYPLAVDASVVLAEAMYRALIVEERSLADAFLYARDRLRERAARAGWASLQLYARAADGPDLRPIVRRPYRGLLAFQEEHARYFFGRDAEVDETIGDLLALVAANNAARPRFLICTGASGTGKSSLVLAGVVPALRATDRRWAVATMRPHDGWKASLQAALASRPTPDAPLLLVVDQLEELFTMIHSRAERETFVRDLWALASYPGSGVSVIATLRVDFLARCGEIQLWSGDHFLEDMAYEEAHRVFIRRMKPEHLRRAIEGPAELMGLSLEEGLCEQMLRDAGDEPGALPLLEYTLDQMWQQRRGRLLTWEQYNELGGVGGALEKKADAILAGFDEVRRQTARRLLVQLVTLDCDARLDRRRRVPLHRLRRGAPVEAAVFGEVLDTLARERLLVLSGGDDGAGPRSLRGELIADTGASKSPVVEVAHEQLIRSWGTLRAWVREDRQMLAELQRLDRWVEESKGFPRYVLDSDRLGQARDLLARYAADVGEAARKLILRSERAAARRRRLSVATAIMASVAAVMMGVTALWAFYERDAARQAASTAEEAQKKSEEQTRLARDASEKARQQEELAKEASHKALEQATWAQRAGEEAEEQESEAKLQATRAEHALIHAEKQARRARNSSLIAGARELLARGQAALASRLLADVVEPDTVEGWARTALDVLVHGFPRATLRGHTKPVVAAAWSPDGKRIVTASADYTVRVWSAEGAGDPIVFHYPGLSHVNTVEMTAAWSPDGKRVVALFNDSAAYVWNADGSGDPVVLRGHEGIVASTAFSPDGKRVVTTSDDGTARVWSADGSGEPIVLHGDDASLRFAAFSPDGKRVIVTGVRGVARVWSADGSGEPVVLQGHTDTIRHAAFSPDGERVVTASDDTTARVWNVDGSGEPVVLRGHTQEINTAAWSPDGEHIVTASDDRTAQLWKSNHLSSPPRRLEGHGDKVVSAAWSRDSMRVVTASRDGTARVWSATSDAREPLVLLEHERALLSAAWSPGGDRIVTTSADALARVWSTENYGDAALLKGSTSPFHSASLSPDGKHIVTTSPPSSASERERPALVWRTDRSGRPSRLGDEDRADTCAAWSPDGKRIVTGSADGTAHVFGADGSGGFVLRKHTNAIRAVAWSPDGGRVVTASTDATIVWSADGSGTPVVFGEEADGVNAAAWSPDGQRIATAQQSRVRIWRADGSGEPVALDHHGDEVNSLAWSPDGKHLVTASRDKTARIWSAASPGSQPMVLRGHEGAVLSAAWSPDGKRVVTASSDGTARVFSAHECSMPMVLRDHRSAVPFAAFSADGRRVITAAGDGSLRSWAVSSEALQRRLRKATTECLSVEMRLIYLGESAVDAQKRHEACERSHDRTPLALQEQP
ncbi:uncharacterized protein SOCE26_062160 [Sorangium cellulosum]|uniref:Uncharacterized protein n=1 Tax=Sorangium cellulosum TaxID=56 RepID=A0A2L0EZL4_SORCE|nr:CHAT domain-containing protein [Sorangium cellulosum]AUX44748.1 uncharacterized protein SOCE26_062160 [Sorangium cellulosum]